MKSNARNIWLQSPRFDLFWIVGPGLISTLVAVTFNFLEFTPSDFATWLLLIVGIDVTHVYCTLFRTYLHPKMRKNLGNALFTIPFACAVLAILLYSLDGLIFWRCMAYMALYHFMRQQEGILRLYQDPQNPRSQMVLERSMILLAMLAPVAYWHTHLPREFHWFVSGDFLGIPFPKLATGLYLLFAAACAIWFCMIAAGKISANILPRLAIITSTALAWNMGIVLFNDDFAFTVTNVVTHGVPYMALVWIVSKREESSLGWAGNIFKRPSFYFMALAVLMFVALIEELLWHRGPSLQRGGGQSLNYEVNILLVGLIAMPQLTHYILDGMIWKKRYLCERHLS